MRTAYRARNGYVSRQLETLYGQRIFSAARAYQLSLLLYHHPLSLRFARYIDMALHLSTSQLAAARTEVIAHIQASPEIPSYDAPGGVDFYQGLVRGPLPETASRNHQLDS